MTTNPQILLASSSPYRKTLLERLGLAFTTASPNVDETPHPNETPKALAERLAASKARALSQQYPKALIIGSDQTADCNGTLLGKPGTEKAAITQLAHCSGQQVNFYTGLSLLNSQTGEQLTTSIEYRVEFLALTDTQIRAYIKKEQPQDCAGSFKCEGLGSALFNKLEGEDPTALVGLPLIALCKMLRHFGIDPLKS
ncbi:Maf family nucleotide pyrophosphatase [Simiduia sp. 21SJ11W-1]|uniref:Maf family protein n=1 Tax=Simiduia sp. 21SJ11W-1 TaxID=2909669 RepID=UPI00209EDA4A|nr:Maf family nucleotide pyrophosphatase [Simiduia sp. 21SJ11W-1]UTA46347.1 Maf family nucleotide pyrophosphatase [Simiduia sp. 21SJ11W-1]